MAHFPNRRKILLLLLLPAAAGLTIYAAHKLYHHRTISTLIRALSSFSVAVASTSSTVSLLSADLHAFLSSDSDDLPTSLAQISKLSASLGFPDRVLSAVAGSFGRGLAEGIAGSGSRSGSVDSVPWWVELVCLDKLRPLILDSIRIFTTTAVGVYVEKTVDVNIYDEFFAGLTNPSHAARMKDVLVSVCDGAVETFVRISHRVLLVGSDKRGFVRLVGKVVFEIVCSFLGGLGGKVVENGRRGVDVVVERGMEVLMYVSAKSIVVVVVTLLVCLYVASDTRIFVVPVASGN